MVTALVPVMNINAKSRIIRVSSAALVVSISLISCTGESSKTEDAAGIGLHANHLPVIRSIRINPSPLVLNRPITAQVEGSDADGDLITYRQQWKVNDSGVTYGLLDSKTLKRGDRLSVEVVPYDGRAQGVAVRAEAVMGNTPPEVTKLLFDPSEIRVGDYIRTQVTGSDADNDPIEYRFRWWRNNSEVADGEASELSTEGFVKGDTVVVEVTPADPIEKGKSKLSEPSTILNSAPKITSAPPTKIERGGFVYLVTANDPDGDSLIYALEMAPPGMKIDKKTGKIEWPLTGKLAGNYKVRVTATDGDQAHAFQEFDLAFPSPPTSSRLSRNFRVNTRLVTSSAALLE